MGKAEAEDAEYYIKQARNSVDCMSVVIVDARGERVAGISFKESSKGTHIYYLGSKRKRLGTKLVKMIEACTTSRPLRVLAESQAVGFYTKLGFIPVRQQRLGRAHVTNMRKD